MTSLECKDGSQQKTFMIFKCYYLPRKNKVKLFTPSFTNYFTKLLLILSFSVL